MEVILYSTHCPKCEVLKKKLDGLGIKYEEINDLNVMKKKGFLSAPMIEADNNIMNFVEANKWINTLSKETN